MRNDSAMKKLFLSPFGLKREEQIGSWFTSHAVGIHGCKTQWLNHHHPNHKNTIVSTGKSEVGVPWRSSPPSIGVKGRRSPFLQLSLLSAAPTTTAGPQHLLALPATGPRSQKNLISLPVLQPAGFWEEVSGVHRAQRGG